MTSSSPGRSRIPDVGIDASLSLKQKSPGLGARELGLFLAPPAFSRDLDQDVSCQTLFSSTGRAVLCRLGELTHRHASRRPTSCGADFSFRKPCVLRPCSEPAGSTLGLPKSVSFVSSQTFLRCGSTSQNMPIAPGRDFFCPHI